MSIARRVEPSRLELNKPRGVVERGALGEGQFYDLLVGFAGAEDSAVRPNRDASPFPLLDRLRVRLFDEGAHPGQRLAAPVVELLDPRIDQLRGGGSCSFAQAARRFPGGSVWRRQEAS